MLCHYMAFGPLLWITMIFSLHATVSFGQSRAFCQGSSETIGVTFPSPSSPLFNLQRHYWDLASRQNATNLVLGYHLPDHQAKYQPVVFISFQFSSVSQSCLFVTPWIAARQASLSITISRSSPKLMSIELVMPSSHLILCHPLILLPSIPPSIRVFSNESTLHMRWPKYWSFSFSISSSNEQPGLISFRMDWLDLLAVQRTLKSLLQHHSSQASILHERKLSFLHSPTLTSIHDHWKNHNLD